MTEMCYASGINPSAIPGEDLDPDAVETAANGLSTGGGKVRDAGADVLTKWRGLSAHYEAPEAAQLFTVMNPVETKAREFGEAVTSVAGALRSYAAEIRPIKAGLDAVRADAWAFRDSIASNAEWEYDQDLVDENTALVKRVNDLQVQLWEAERRCANAIRALYGADPWRAMTSENDPLGYGVGEIPTDAAMPWGSEVQRKDHCPKSAAVGVKRFVWDGVVVDGLWGTVQGLGMLVGIDGNGWSWDTMKSSWVGMGSLIGYSGGDWSWDNAGEAWKGLGKGLISYDTWEDDPARAAGGSVFNIATIFIPAGAAVSGTKGAATAAGNAGRVSTLFAKGAKIVDFTDPVNLAIQGGKVVLPKLDDLVRGLGTTISDLSAAIDLPDIRTPDLDVPNATLDELLDGPPVRDPELGSPDDVPAPQPAPEPALVGGGAPDGPGGLGNGADDLHQPPTTTPGTSTGGSTGGTGTDVPTGGTPDSPSTGGSTPGGNTPGGSAPGGSTPGGTTPGGTTPGGTTPGDMPGSGGADDVVPGGDIPGTTPEAPGAPDTPPPGSGDVPPSGTGTGEPGRVVIDDSGTPHVINTSDDLVLRNDPAFTQVLDEQIAQHGLTRPEFDDLVTTPIEQLSRDQVTTLLEIRDAMPPVTPDTVLQKILPPTQALDILGPDGAGLMEPDLLTRASAQGPQELTGVGGFVGRAADVAGQSPQELYRSFGLNYDEVTFRPDGESMFAVRYRAGDGVSGVGSPVTPDVPHGPLEAMRTMPDSIYEIADDGARRVAIKQWIDEHASDASFAASRALDIDGSGAPNLGPDRNPFRGNGFGGTGADYAPELTYGRNSITVPQGAELWRLRPDGTQELAAVFHDRRWHLIAEQPTVVP